MRSKFLLSFFKRNWDLGDYPIEVRHQQLTGETLPIRFDLANYVASIQGWLRMTGTGDSREEAYKNLRTKFDEYKAEGNKLPRPGTKVPLQFAPRDQIAEYDEIATDFFRRVLDMDYHRIMITDESSLWDFPLATTEIELGNKIQDLYDIDISGIEDGNLMQIFAIIAGDRAESDAGQLRN